MLMKQKNENLFILQFFPFICLDFYLVFSIVFSRFGLIVLLFSNKNSLELKTKQDNSINWFDYNRNDDYKGQWIIFDAYFRLESQKLKPASQKFSLNYKKQKQLLVWFSWLNWKCFVFQTESTLVKFRIYFFC